MGPSSHLHLLSGGCWGVFCAEVGHKLRGIKECYFLGLFWLLTEQESWTNSIFMLTILSIVLVIVLTVNFVLVTSLDYYLIEAVIYNQRCVLVCIPVKAN